MAVCDVINDAIILLCTFMHFYTLLYIILYTFIYSFMCLKNYFFIRFEINLCRSIYSGDSSTTSDLLIYNLFWPKERGSILESNLSWSVSKELELSVQVFGKKRTTGSAWVHGFWSFLRRTPVRIDLCSDSWILVEY